MPDQDVITTRRGAALIVTFNRPEQGNALTLDSASHLHTVLKNATTDRAVRAVLLQGAGGSFMEGFDKSLFTAGDMDQTLEQTNQLVQPYHGLIRELQTMDKPVLAAVQGRVSSAGLSLMLASDLVIAAQSARFASGFAESALSAMGGSSFFLPRKIGASRALELFLCDEELSAEKAESLNLVNRVVEDASFEAEALAWLDRLASGPTRAFGSMKKLVAKAFDQDLNAQLGLEHGHLGTNSRSFDFRDAVKALRQGQRPKFSGV